MALNQQIWLNEFAEKLLPKPDFFTGAINDSADVTFNKVILANYSGTPTVSELLIGTSLPVAVSQIAHTEQSYDMATYVSSPTFIHNIESTEFAYDKRMVVMGEHISYMNAKLAEVIAWGWTTAATSSILSTSGTATRANRFGNSAIKRLILADILAAQTKLNLQNVPMDGRRLLVDAYMWEDLILQAATTGFSTLISPAVVDGSVGRIYGFDVFMNNSTAGFVTGGATKRALSAAVAATDLSSAIAYHPNFVRFAYGNKDNGAIKVFIQENDPTLYASSFSTLLRMGSTTKYVANSNVVAGVVTIVESK